VNRLSLLRAHWDRSLAALLLLLGVVILFIGYRGVNDVPFASQQIPYVLSAGLGGVFLLGVAGTLWLSADLQDEWRKLHRLEQVLERLPEAAPAVAAAGDGRLDRDREDLLLRLAARVLDEQDVRPPEQPAAAPRQRRVRTP
jgi:hypothetical protein